MTETDRPILIVDCYNAFTRAYCSFPQMSSHGYQMGGTIGFLKTLRKIVEETSPSAVYIAWEGGGSSRRRAIFPEYKLNRKPVKLNRFYGDDLPDSEENKQHQVLALLSILKHVPVCQVYGSDCEADDVIAYMCKVKFKNKNKIIVSSDKDMYQLLDDSTRVWSLHKKTFVTHHDVYNEFRVTANNFAVAKALCGDSGDNVPGIKGMGFKRVATLFPTLGTDTDVLLSDINSYCHAHLDEAPMYKRVLAAWPEVERNWKLVYLDGGMIAANQVQRIDNAIDTFVPTASRMQFIKKLIEEGISDFNVEMFFYTFNVVVGLKFA